MTECKDPISGIVEEVPPDDPSLHIRRQVEDVLFGSLAGMVGKVVEYPFDTVKVRLQTQSVSQPLYTGPIDCITSAVRQEGLRGLYKGMASPLVGAMLENATLFVGYRQLQRVIRHYEGLPEDSPLSMNQLLVAGCASGALASVVLTPAELIKCKLQVQFALDIHQKYSGPFHVISHTLRTHGITGFYRGFMATLIRETGGGAFWFGAYEYTCAILVRQRQKYQSTPVTKKDLTPPELMFAGAFGGVGYNVSFFPVDVIKSQMQTDEELMNHSRQRTFGEVAKEIYRGAGIRGFYRGCGITAARSAPSSAIIFMTYELLTRHFGC